MKHFYRTRDRPGNFTNHLILKERREKLKQVTKTIPLSSVKIAELMTEKRALEKELESYQGFGKTSEPESKLNEISHITEIIENQPLQFDDNLIRQMLECVVVQSKEQIKIVFKDGTEVDQPLS